MKKILTILPKLNVRRFNKMKKILTLLPKKVQLNKLKAKIDSVRGSDALRAGSAKDIIIYAKKNPNIVPKMIAYLEKEEESVLKLNKSIQETIIQTGKSFELDLHFSQNVNMISAASAVEAC